MGGAVSAVTNAVSSAAQTVTHSVGSAVDSAVHGDVIGAVTSVGNAVNPVAIGNAAITGQTSSNLGDTVHIFKDEATKVVGTVSKTTGLSPQELTQAGMAVATGGTSAIPAVLGDVASGAISNAINPKPTPVSNARPASGAAAPTPTTIVQSSTDYTPYLLIGGGLLVVVLLLKTKGRK